MSHWLRKCRKFFLFFLSLSQIEAKPKQTRHYFQKSIENFSPNTTDFANVCDINLSSTLQGHHLFHPLSAGFQSIFGGIRFTY